MERLLTDLEDLRADIDFRFAMSPKPSGNKGEGGKYPSVRWSLTVTVGVAEREEKTGWWSTKYGAINRAARRAFHHEQKAGGNTVSK